MATSADRSEPLPLITPALLEHAQQDSGFEAACRLTLAFLRQRLEFSLWMITRVVGEDWIVLFTANGGYGIQEGDILNWSDSLCFRMVAGDAPNVAPRVDQIPILASAPLCRTLAVGAYLGVPLTDADGTLYGTLCAIDPKPAPARLVEEQPLLELLGGLLSALIRAEAAGNPERRGDRGPMFENLFDPITGLNSLAGWERLLAAEDQRCRSQSRTAGILVFTLRPPAEHERTPAGLYRDSALQRLASGLVSQLDPEDVMARLRLAEFGVLLSAADPEALERKAHVLRDRLLRMPEIAALGYQRGRGPEGISLYRALAAARDQLLPVQDRIPDRATSSEDMSAR